MVYSKKKNKQKWSLKKVYFITDLLYNNYLIDALRPRGRCGASQENDKMEMEQNGNISEETKTPERSILKF